MKPGGTHRRGLAATTFRQRILEQVVGDAVEQVARDQGHRLNLADAIELDTLVDVLLGERPPPVGRLHHVGRPGTAGVELVERALEPLGDLRQLPPDESQQCIGVIATAVRRGGTKRAQRLQQVLDVVREARAGFIDRLQIVGLALRLFAYFRVVVVAEQARQQAHMQQQCRCRPPARVEAQIQPAEREMRVER